MSGLIRRRDAARMLLSKQHVSDSFKLVRPPLLGNSILAGAQAATAVAVAVSAVALSPLSHMIGVASLGAMAALFGRFAPKARRTLIVFYAMLCLVSAVFVTSVASFAGLGMAGLLVLLSVLGAIYFLICMIGRFGPPGPLIFMFAAMAGMNPPSSWAEIGTRVGVTVFGGLVAILVCALSEKLRRHDPAGDAVSVPVRHQLAKMAPAFWRLSIGAAVAGLLAHGMGASHPGWAAMGATAALQGVHLHLTLHRALQRVAGTIVGGLMIWVVLAQEPSIWTGIVLLVVLQLLTELVIGFNYALGTMFVTPMALLMTYLATPGSAGAAMAPERIIDTVIGAVIGVVIAIILSTRQDRHHLHSRHQA